ncbi:MAG: methyltransferase domain-containing protein [Rhodospirillales bacterium]|nr:methyltransferase domain-containing protein [Rhodospirillales bacterium]
MDNATSMGGLLGGRLSYRQLRTGHRTGFEPVLMAAMVPAKAGELVLEAGTGAGAALLCLAARVPDMCGVGVERRDELAVLAAQNFAENQFSGLSVVNGDATTLPFAAQTFQHVMANPPWFGAHNTPSPDAARALAHHAPQTTLAAWIKEMLRLLRDKGTITLALPAATYAEAVSLLRPACGGITLLPLWPRAGVKAKLILVQAQRASRTPDALLPGLVLHDENGITKEAEAVLREGAALTDE